MNLFERLAHKLWPTPEPRTPKPAPAPLPDADTLWPVQQAQQAAPVPSSAPKPAPSPVASGNAPSFGRAAPVSPPAAAGPARASSGTPPTEQALALQKLQALPLDEVERTLQAQELRVQALDEQAARLAKEHSDCQQLFMAARLRAHDPQKPSPEMQAIARTFALIKRKLKQLEPQRSEALGYVRLTQLLVNLIQQSRLSESIRQSALNGMNMAELSRIINMGSLALQQQAREQHTLVSEHEHPVATYNPDHFENQAALEELFQATAPAYQHDTAQELAQAQDMWDSMADPTAAPTPRAVPGQPAPPLPNV